MSDPIVTDVEASHKFPSLIDYFDRPIAFHRAFATLAGSAGGGVMLSQAVYWARRTQDPDGWFYKTQAEWEEETALTDNEQLTVRKRLRGTTFWHEKRAGLPAKLYFRIDFAELEQALLRLPPPRPLRGKKPQQTHQSTEKQETSLPPASGLDAQNPANQFPEIPSPITETTTESTIESSPEIDTNVGTNVGDPSPEPKRHIHLDAREEETVEAIENQLQDWHSRPAVCMIVHRLGWESALRLLWEAVEIKDAGRLKKSLSECYMDLCQRDAQRQGIDLGFQRP